MAPVRADEQYFPPQSYRGGPAGNAAKGYIAITTQASGQNYPVVKEIVKTVYGAPPEVGIP